ncbi:MAG: Fic family protein [bacterium]
MASTLHCRWEATYDGASRRDRRGCTYDAYVPDALMGRQWVIDGDVAADIADAEAEILRFNSRSTSLTDTEGIARLLLRAEAVASSRIEGLEAGPRRILRAEAAQNLGEESLDVGADEILGNIRAMQFALNELTGTTLLSPAAICSMHTELMAKTRHEYLGGVIRKEQNWIGGTSYNPCAASFVPPPPEMVMPLLEDLCLFASGNDLSPLTQAAIAHAQFETIHPFADGNGRAGRALIHVILRRRGLTPAFVPPVSLVLATWSDRYVSGLNAAHYLGPADGARAREGINSWLATFAAATRRAVQDASNYEEHLETLQKQWRDVLGPIRSDSAIDRLLRRLPGTPIFTVKTAAELIGRSFESMNLAVARMEAGGVIQKTVVGRRNRAFEVPQLIDAFTGLERGLASPVGDTLSAPPVRPVPRKPRKKP